MLAEYRLEHIIEDQREKKYIHSLIKDIEMYIASLQIHYENRKQHINYLDSLKNLLKHDHKNHLNDVYFYARHIARFPTFQYHDRTIQQLKNSGNFRLIRNENAADSITVYDNEKIKSLLSTQEGEFELRRLISRNLLGKIFDPFVWSEISDSAAKITRPAGNPLLLTDDPGLLNEFCYNVVLVRGSTAFTNRLIANALISAKNLLELLRKEYNLD
ncbi:MAG TPA: hypothetical protein VFO37_08805, partial [Chitinophagaceae bacterium]|nr:hypothetical protein [Chitinophagaceae bacterium]